MTDHWGNGQIPVVTQDPTDPAFVQDPYPFYASARAMGDFVFWREFGMPVATTQAAGAAVLRHPRLGREVPAARRVSVPAGLESFYALEKHSLLELEPPEHTRLRRIAMEGFGRHRISAMAPSVSQIADDLIGAFPTGEFDLIEAFAKPLPAIAIARFIGLPDDMAPRLQDWSNAMVRMYQAGRTADDEVLAEAAAREFTEYLRDVIGHRKKTPGVDFLSDLIRLETSGDRLGTDELISTVVLLLNAGHEATVHSIGNAVALLTRFRERALALGPLHIADTVEECLRFDPPLHFFDRHVYEATRIRDTGFAAGDRVGVLLASANRDDAVWPDGERFDPFRLRRSHLAFGSGIHVCIGASLARLEMQIALPALFSRCPNLKITQPPKVAKLYHFHGYERLMVQVR